MANQSQASFEQEFTKIQWLKDKLTKGIACKVPVNKSKPEKDCGPDDIISISDWRGIIRELAHAANINYTKANFKTKRLLFELSLMVTKDSSDGIASAEKDRIGNNVPIANDVREGFILGVKETNFDRVIGKFSSNNETGNTINPAWITEVWGINTLIKNLKKVPAIPEKVGEYVLQGDWNVKFAKVMDADSSGNYILYGEVKNWERIAYYCDKSNTPLGKAMVKSDGTFTREWKFTWTPKYDLKLPVTVSIPTK